ncbi:MAG: Eco57I restriction-modification methylase domain-containing protein [Candidatus Lokiarchaeota archaeon]|nr:Eco57I restriction-modification methylase domain-containing protein [Candidatus Lokiarchaeota archaeon]
MASQVFNYNDLSNEKIIDIFQSAILKGVKLEKYKQIKDGKALESRFLIIESDPESYTRNKLEPQIKNFLPNVELHAEIHKKTSLGKLKKPDASIASKDLSINNNLLIEWEPFNEDLRARKEHGVNQAKLWISDINIGNYNNALVTNGKKWISIKTQKIKEEIRVVEQELTVKEALKLMENVYNAEKIHEKPIEEAIDITEKFYKWYVALIYGGEYIDKENNRKRITKEDSLLNNVSFASTEQEKKDFIRLNFTRLIFIRILSEYGIIKDDILNFLKSTEPEDFYNRINQLFFETLNTPLNLRENIPKIYENIPFLNGDLFRKKEIDGKGLKVQRKSFVHAIQFLRTFNFRKEYEDLENNFKIDNTIDPEILGHILEKTIEDRKESGVYYTPQVITEYMAKEIIEAYVKNQVSEFLKKREDNQWRYIDNFKDIFDLDTLILKKIYIKIIKPLKICDPAVGSGAFLLSCGNTLFNIRKDISKKIELSESDYSIKKEIIQNNLYGIDIKEPAVDICKLRLWLWIIEKQAPEPLPNIDFNIRKGNSLIGYTNTETIKIDPIDISSWVKKSNLIDIFLERNEIIKQYYSIEDPIKQKNLKKDIDKLTKDFNEKLNVAFVNDLSKEKVRLNTEDLKSFDIFHWIMEFSEVFEKKNGFDIVIGNPPYFRITSAPKLEQKIIGKLGILKNYHHGQGDIHYDFTVRSYELLREGGYFSFITSRYWLESAYSNYLKKFFKERVKLLKIIDFREQLLFKGVDIHNSILCYTKKQPSRNRNFFEVFLFNEDFAKELKNLDLNDYLEKAGEFDLGNWKNDENWAFTPKLHKELFMKIKKIKTKLGDDYNCNQYTNSFRRKHKPILIFDDKPKQIPEEYLRKYRKMGEVRKFCVEPLISKYVVVIHNKEKAWKDSQLKRYLLSNNISKVDLIEIKKESEKNIDKFDEVIYIGYRIPRLVYNFTYEDNKTCIDNTYFITKKKVTAFSLKYLTAVLNSNLMRYFIDIMGKKKEQEIEIGSTFLKNLPIILRRGSLDDVKLNQIKIIEQIVSDIIKLEKKNENIDEKVNQLNEFIYNLYDVTEEEKTLIIDYISEKMSKLYY